MDKDITTALDLANTHSNEGDYELAIDILKETLENHPNNLSVRTTLGVIFAKANRDRESENMLRSVIRRNPYHEEATSALGRLLDNSLRIEESEQLYRKFLQAKPESYLITTDFTRMLLEEGRVDEAFSIARDYIEKNPNEVKAYTVLRQLLLLEETRLEDNMIDSDYDPKDWESLASNLIEQYDLIKKIEQLTDTIEVESEFVDLIQDELYRLLGKFEELQNSLECIDGKVSKHALDRMNQVLVEISEQLIRK